MCFLITKRTSYNTDDKQWCAIAEFDNAHESQKNKKQRESTCLLLLHHLSFPFLVISFHFTSANTLSLSLSLYP
ncbi:hypothetical protein RJT34_11492 [Clitoria ternatea]|uniref:Uncharacterized protein n=1 Tax=Clitoria ternatea TaxID=43366 RepID=A0AAN9JM11_CLITE